MYLHFMDTGTWISWGKQAMFAPQQRFNEITLALPGKIWEGYIHSKSKHSLYTNVIECNLFMLLNYLYMTNDHTCTYVLY